MSIAVQYSQVFSLRLFHLYHLQDTLIIQDPTSATCIIFKKYFWQSGSLLSAPLHSTSSLSVFKYIHWILHLIYHFPEMLPKTTKNGRKTRGTQGHSWSRKALQAVGVSLLVLHLHNTCKKRHLLDFLLGKRRSYWCYYKRQRERLTNIWFWSSGWLGLGFSLPVFIKSGLAVSWRTNRRV